MPADGPRNDIEVPLSRTGEFFDSPARGETAGAADEEPSLGALLRRLTNDTTDLLRQEVELAKAEVRETGQRLVRDATQVGIAVGLALVGALTLTAWLVIAVASLLGGRYGWSAFLVGAVATIAGYVMMTRVLRDIRDRGVTPRESLASLREDAAWIRQEARDLREELTGDAPPPIPPHLETGSDRAPPQVRP